MSDYSNEGDCFVSIDIDGNKLTLTTGRGCIGIKFDQMGDYVYMNRPETELLVYALMAAADKVDKSLSGNREDDQ